MPPGAFHPAALHADICRMEDTTRHRLRIAAYATAFAACLVLGFFPFVRQESVPFLWGVDLGFHELGHLLTGFWAPRIVAAASGSFTQVAVPLGLAAYFHFARKDRVGVALMLAWAGTSMANAAAYIADAPYQQLELLGGPGGHDWAFIFGPEGFNNLPASGPFSTAVWIVGAVLLVFAAGLCAYGLAEEVRTRFASAREAGRLATLPHREPRNPVLVLAGADSDAEQHAEAGSDLRVPSEAGPAREAAPGTDDLVRAVSDELLRLSR
jgi:hypothetical protein